MILSFHHLISLTALYGLSHILEQAFPIEMMKDFSWFFQICLRQDATMVNENMSLPQENPDPSESILGLYDYAAVAVDSKPCAKIGKYDRCLIRVGT